MYGVVESPNKIDVIQPYFENKRMLNSNPDVPWYKGGQGGTKVLRFGLESGEEENKCGGGRSGYNLMTFNPINRFFCLTSKAITIKI